MFLLWFIVAGVVFLVGAILFIASPGDPTRPKETKPSGGNPSWIDKAAAKGVSICDTFDYFAQYAGIVLLIAGTAIACITGLTWLALRVDDVIAYFMH